MVRGASGTRNGVSGTKGCFRVLVRKKSALDRLVNSELRTNLKFSRISTSKISFRPLGELRKGPFSVIFAFFKAFEIEAAPRTLNTHVTPPLVVQLFEKRVRTAHGVTDRHALREEQLGTVL